MTTAAAVFFVDGRIDTFVFTRDTPLRTVVVDVLEAVPTGVEQAARQEEQCRNR